MFKNLDDKCWIIGWIVFGICMLGTIVMAVNGFNEDTVMGVAYLIGGFVASWLMAMPFFIYAHLIESTDDIKIEVNRMKNEISLLSKRVNESIKDTDPV